MRPTQMKNTERKREMGQAWWLTSQKSEVKDYHKFVASLDYTVGFKPA